MDKGGKIGTVSLLMILFICVGFMLIIETENKEEFEAMDYCYEYCDISNLENCTVDEVKEKNDDYYCIYYINGTLEMDEINLSG